MTKIELVKEFGTMLETSDKRAAEMVDAVVFVIAEALRRKETVTLRGFGTFGTKEVAARKGRNPKTGEEIEIPAKTKAYWKPAL